MWDAFLAAAEDGLATRVGVSNHSLAQLDALTAATGEAPAVNQVRFHPMRYDLALVAGHEERGVHLGVGNPVTHGARMPDAFAYTLPYVAAAFLAAFALLYAVPRTAGRNDTRGGTTTAGVTAPDNVAEAEQAAAPR
ncbi:hypothetical protein [Streptomyces sp. YGL11-2]|uniref:hypothetical protein n=1 Tax=Streptomyces sp. YGL11-2 TaxID=3414028 RepID=UPI003CEBD879